MCVAVLGRLLALAEAAADEAASDDDTETQRKKTGIPLPDSNTTEQNTGRTG